MSLCQRCNQAKATVHVTDTVPEKRERYLCEDCAEKENIIIKQKHQNPNDILQQFIKHKVGATGKALDDLTCPQCGMTFREFQAKGQLGCPNDYTVFQAFLMPLIERAHEGATHHVGKVPPTEGTTVQRQTGLQRLRRELQDAVEQENYEQAARVRDQIRQMETHEN